VHGIDMEAVMTDNAIADTEPVAFRYALAGLGAQYTYFIGS
jgi:hypothetical protein